MARGTAAQRAANRRLVTILVAIVAVFFCSVIVSHLWFQ